LRADVIDDPEAGVESLPRECVNQLLELGFDLLLVGIDGQADFGRVPLHDMRDDKRCAVLTCERFRDGERSGRGDTAVA
jgi:hypothetical protein